MRVRYLLLQLSSIVLVGLFLCACASYAQAQTTSYIFKLDGVRVVNSVNTPVTWSGEFTLNDAGTPVYHGKPGESDQQITGVMACTLCAPLSVAEPFVDFGGQWRTKQKGILLIFSDVVATVVLPNDKVNADGTVGHYEGYLNIVSPNYRGTGTIKRK